MRLYLLGLYTARLELFKFFFVFCIGFLLWSIFLFHKNSGSLSRKKKRFRALIMIVISSLLIFLMGVSWLLSRTNFGWWFDKL
jgi:biotin transporter BioY